jgi:hypothetical protein
VPPRDNCLRRAQVVHDDRRITLTSITTTNPRPTILNSAGQQIIEQAFRERSRQRASFLDVADATVRTLKQTGQLSAYALPGVDPFEAIHSLLDAERRRKEVRRG